MSIVLLWSLSILLNIVLNVPVGRPILSDCMGREERKKSMRSIISYLYIVLILWRYRAKIAAGRYLDLAVKLIVNANYISHVIATVKVILKVNASTQRQQSCTVVIIKSSLSKIHCSCHTQRYHETDLVRKEKMKWNESGRHAGIRKSEFLAVVEHDAHKKACSLVFFNWREREREFDTLILYCFRESP